MSVSEKAAGASRQFLVAAAAVILAFSWPLYQLIRFSIGHELYSHIVLIPLISAYLAWQSCKVGERGRDKGEGAEGKEEGRKEKEETEAGAGKMSAADSSAPRRGLAFGLLAFGVFTMGAFFMARSSGMKLAVEDSLALTTLSFLGFFTGTCAWFLGRSTLRTFTFPLTFLVFMVPFPIFMLDWIESGLQHGSAAVAQALFAIAGTTVFVDGLVFQLTTITIQVAPECSGIHSTLALLITTVLAAHFFLRSTAHRSILALAVIPLALLRNGFRVFVIGELCVRVGPHMINSDIHRQGGPIFFVLSLIPFFLLLFFLVRSERRQARATKA